MKIIFLKDVPKLGKKDDIKEMSDGYVRNFLLPRKLVEEATPKALERLAERLADRNTAHAFAEARVESTLKALSGVSITMVLPANEKGNLFKAVSAKDIAPLLTSAAGVIVSEDFLKDVHIKTIGEHTVVVSIGNKKTECVVTISAK